VLITIPFLSPALLGVMLVGAIACLAALPPSWRRWWLVAGAALAAGAVAGGVGLVPWIGSLHLTGYSLAMLAAFVAAYLATVPRARILGIAERTIVDLFLVGLIGGLVGARLGEVIEQWPYFAQAEDGSPLSLGELLAKAADIDGGGMVWYGGAITGGVLIMLVAWQRRIAPLALADLLMPAVVLGLGIGRIGCFVNGCCFGRPTDLPWAISRGGAQVHPTQLYETIACLGLFALTWWWWRHRRWQGEVVALGIAGYAVWRFINEGLRGDTVGSSFLGLWPVTTSQAVSLYLVCAVGAATAVVVWRRRRDPALAAQARVVPGSRHHRAQAPGNEAPPCD
jgi:phosphatidylglycerol:prolipoprotein diacylglycerol transferase